MPRIPFFRRKFEAQILERLDTLVLDFSKLQQSDADIASALTALLPVAQAAVDAINRLNTGDVANQTLIDAETTKNASSATAITSVTAALNAALNPAPPPPPPGPTPAPPLTPGGAAPAAFTQG